MSALRKIPEVVASSDVDALEASDNITGPWTIIGKKASYEVTRSGTVTKVIGLSLNPTQGIKEGNTVALTVTKAGSAENKEVTWSKSGNVTFVTDLTGATEVSGQEPKTDTVYVKAGALSGGTTGSVSVSALDEEGQTCNITIGGIASAQSTITTNPAYSGGDGTQADPYIMTVQEGKTGSISVAVKDTNGSVTTADSITYTSGTPSVAKLTLGATVEANSVSETDISSSTVTVKGIAENATGSIITISIDSVTKYVKVVVLESSSFGEAQRVGEYGYKVTGYISTAETNQDDIGWRLFYQDSENTYLIANIPQGNYKPSTYYAASGETRYANGASVSDEGKMLNGKLNSKYPAAFESSNTNDNIRAVAWMTDTTNTLWSKYKDSEGKASWAVASPSIELFVASFNAVKADIDTKRATGTTEEAARAAISFSPASDTGYTWSTSGLSTGYNHGIYNYSSSSYWWFASPDCNSSGYVLNLYGGGSNVVDGGTGTKNPIRPLVCIPTSTFESAVLAGTYTLLDE